jgi:penicillin-binding protein 1B
MPAKKSKRQPAGRRKTTGQTGKKRAKKRSSGRRAAPVRRKRKPSRRRSWLVAKLLLLVIIVIATWVGWQGLTVYRQFEGRLWSVPARVFASPLEIYAGLVISQKEFINALRQLGYRAADGETVREATWWKSGKSLRLMTRSFRFPDGSRSHGAVQIDFDNKGIDRIRAVSGEEIPVLRLDPQEIGSIFPAHGEDRLVLEPDQVPGLLRQALVATEDHNFYRHHGVDPVAVARAAWVNLRSGGIRQGGSTLTQQLIKNYFLDNRRTFGRKIREAVMAIWLDGLYDKEEILTAYVNEIYLGQDGRRAIHGFGLASRFYFGRPLSELDLPETALLVALVRGPSYYNPWKHPERATERRNLVLGLMARLGMVTEETAAKAGISDLALARTDTRAGYFPAYLDLVRHQLERDYKRQDLATEGLLVYTALDPAIQRSAGEALTGGIERLISKNQALGDLNGAIVVTRLQTGEVQAVIGGRHAGFDGFNHALLAERPIGSLVKPAVFLAAIETGRFSLASIVRDEPLSVPLENGDIWQPGNFKGNGEGEVTLVDALARSLNLATVRVGLDAGTENVVRLLKRLGVSKDLKPYPSLLLGAIDMTPFQVAQLYSSLANDGFHMPLRAVREVVDAEGRAVTRYGIEISQAAKPIDVRQVNSGLVQVMARGTGKSARSRLPAGFVTAGKTGTSDQFRDSWFAGFTGDNLAVVWLGHDDGAPTGLTGASGALQIWADLIAAIGGSGYRPPQIEGLVDVWVDMGTGELVTETCGDPVRLALPEETRLPVNQGCGPSDTNLAERVLDWLKRLGSR